MPIRRSNSNRVQIFPNGEEIGPDPAVTGEPIGMSGIVEAILEVGRQRNARLGQLRVALQSGQNELALDIARQLCGISSYEEESHRTDTRIN